MSIPSPRRPTREPDERFILVLQDEGPARGRRRQKERRHTLSNTTLEILPEVIAPKVKGVRGKCRLQSRIETNIRSSHELYSTTGQQTCSLAEKVPREAYAARWPYNSCQKGWGRSKTSEAQAYPAAGISSKWPSKRVVPASVPPWDCTGAFEVSKLA